MPLKDSMTYTGQVISIQQNAESFTKTGGGGISHCHFITLKISIPEDEVVEAQICNDYPELGLFEANDHIKFSVTKRAKGRYTIRFIEKVAKTAGRIVEALTNEESPFPAPEVNRNPVVRGTAIDCAMYNAAHFLQMRGNVSNEQLVALTELLYGVYIKYTPK